MPGLRCGRTRIQGEVPDASGLQEVPQGFSRTPSGKSVLGEPPAAGQTVTAVAPRASEFEVANKIENFLERGQQGFFSRRTWALVAGLVLLPVGLVAWTFASPESLENRSERVARAAVDGDLRTIRDLAATGSREDIDDWYHMIRPRCEELMQRLGSRKPTLETEVKTFDPGQTWADVVVQVGEEEGLQRKNMALPEAAVVGPPPGHPINIALGWKSEGFWGWRLDGRRTQDLCRVYP